MISVHPINNQTELTEFIKFPFKLYKNCPYWVPPITKEEKAFMDPLKNPVFKNAEREYTNFRRTAGMTIALRFLVVQQLDDAEFWRFSPACCAPDVLRGMLS